MNRILRKIRERVVGLDKKIKNGNRESFGEQDDVVYTEELFWFPDATTNLFEKQSSGQKERCVPTNP